MKINADKKYTHTHTHTHTYTYIYSHTLVHSYIHY